MRWLRKVGRIVAAPVVVPATLIGTVLRRAPRGVVTAGRVVAAPIMVPVAIVKDGVEMFEQIRHYARYVVNVVALLVAVLALPELNAVVPVAWLPVVAALTAGLNTILSWLRRVP